MLWLEHIDKLPIRELLPGFRGRFLHSDPMTFAFWEIDKGFVLPGHSHYHEQVAHQLQGLFELTINGESRLLEPGAMTVIPGNAVHSGRAITDCRILDIFYPRRDDYIFNEQAGEMHG